MEEKHYDSDWAKTKSRYLLKDMIQRTLLTFRKPKDIRVLCLPGRDAIEVHQVYDALGIPRENIVGVERNKQYAKEAEQNAPGIKIVRADLEDYLNSQNSFNFDVVSLDYSGPTSPAQINSLIDLLNRLGNDNIVLHHANLIKRDNIGLSVYATGYAFLNAARSATQIEPDEFNERAHDFYENIRTGKKITDDKAEGYSVILRAALEGAKPKHMESIVRFMLGPLYQEFVRLIEKQHQAQGYDIKLDPNNIMNSEGVDKLILSNRLEQSIRLSMSEILSRHRIFDKGFQSLAVMALMETAKDSKFFYVKDLERYSYFSESGSPMVGDISYASYPRYFVQKAREIANSLGYPNRGIVITNPVSLIYKLSSLAQLRDKFRSPKELDLVLEKFNQERQFLGNSSRPVLSKRRFIEELETGMTVEQIKEKYRGWENKPLPQWKAHYTMGTYQSNKMVEEADEDSDLEKITKVEAVDLLSSEIPPEEISTAYPTSFTLPQLRAYKAHITMGTYKE